MSKTIVYKSSSWVEHPEELDTQMKYINSKETDEEAEKTFWHTVEVVSKLYDVQISSIEFDGTIYKTLLLDKKGYRFQLRHPPSFSF